jgi:hypothetical protein
MEHQAHVHPDARLRALLSRTKSQPIGSKSLKWSPNPSEQRPFCRSPVIQ